MATTDMTKFAPEPSGECLLPVPWFHRWTFPRQQKTWRFEESPLFAR